MAIDAVEIYINGLKIRRSGVTNKLLEDEIFTSEFGVFKYIPPKDNDYKGYSYQMGIEDSGIYIKYYPDYNNGELRLRLNIPKIMGGTNICSLFCVNMQELLKKISFKVWPILDLIKAPHLRFWFVSTFECNIDIIDDREKIDAIYSVLKKTSSTSKYYLAKAYDTGGKTRYYVPKRAKLESSDVVIKVYYKLLQLRECDDNFNIIDLFNGVRVINLKPGQDVLRIEITKSRDSIYNDFKPIIICQDSSKSLEESISKPRIGTFEQVFNLKYQFEIIKSALEGLNLDKKILTSTALRNIIRSNAALSKELMKDYWAIIQHENVNDYHKKKPSDSVKIKCLNYVLYSGYNYLYADTEVDSIRIEDVINALPEVQQREIKTYKESNIFNDMLFYKSTPQRIYKGKRY